MVELSFERVLHDAQKLASLIVRAGFQPSMIIGVSRGGWVPARILSDVLGVRQLVSIGLRYTDKDRRDVYAYQLPEPMPRREKLLVVEDCVESGLSLARAAMLVAQKDNDVKTASLYATAHTELWPDFTVKTLDRPPRFPWEGINVTDSKQLSYSDRNQAPLKHGKRPAQL